MREVTTCFLSHFCPICEKPGKSEVYSYFQYIRKSRYRTSFPMSRTGFSHAIFCFTSATMALTACCIKVIYSLFRIFTHQLVVVWNSASSGSARFFIYPGRGGALLHFLKNVPEQTPDFKEYMRFVFLTFLLLN